MRMLSSPVASVARLCTVKGTRQLGASESVRRSSGVSEVLLLEPIVMLKAMASSLASLASIWTVEISPVTAWGRGKAVTKVGRRPTTISTALPADVRMASVTVKGTEKTPGTVELPRTLPAAVTERPGGRMPGGVAKVRLVPWKGTASSPWLPNSPRAKTMC